MVAEAGRDLAHAHDLNGEAHFVSAGRQGEAVNDDGEALAGGEVEGRLGGDGGHLARDGAEDEIDLGRVDGLAVDT